jgi:hypothetical protein
MCAYRIETLLEEALAEAEDFDQAPERDADGTQEISVRCFIPLFRTNYSCPLSSAAYPNKQPPSSASFGVVQSSPKYSRLSSSGHRSNRQLKSRARSCVSRSQSLCRIWRRTRIVCGCGRHWTRPRLYYVTLGDHGGNPCGKS